MVSVVAFKNRVELGVIWGLLGLNGSYGPNPVGQSSNEALLIARALLSSKSTSESEQVASEQARATNKISNSKISNSKSSCFASKLKSQHQASSTRHQASSIKHHKNKQILF